jgi:hypothetical protein
MGCACKNKGKIERFTVKLPGGLKITKNTAADAAKFAAKHPGSTVTKGVA